MTALPILALAPFTTEFSGRSALPIQSDYLWQIESGFVRALTWLEDGTTVVLGIWGAGELVARPSYKSDYCQLECMTKVAATPVAISQVFDYPDLLLKQMHQLETLLQIRSCKRVDIMLLRFLSWLADRFGKITPQGRMVDLRLTHLDMAESIGTTRVTITRILKQLEQQGIIAHLPLKRIVLHQEDLWHYEI